MREWEVVTERPGNTTERLPVPGGWLYRSLSWIPQGNGNTGSHESTESLAFVPNPSAGKDSPHAP